MCLHIREYVGSSEAEWNQEPGAYVFKSQLSQAPSLLWNSVDVRGTGISFDSVCSSMLLEYVCMHVHYTQPIMISIMPTYNILSWLLSNMLQLVYRIVPLSYLHGILAVKGFMLASIKHKGVTVNCEEERR